MNYKKLLITWRIIYRGVFTVLLGVGIVGFVGSLPCTIIAQYFDSQIMTSVRFPLSVVPGVCVDRNGDIYCISNNYKRIQVYDSRGRFLRGWFVPFKKSGVGIDIDENLHVKAYGLADRPPMTFSTTGKEILLQPGMTARDRKKNSESGSGGVLRSVDGVAYSFSGDDGFDYSFSGDKVYRIDPETGKQSLVLSDPWYLHYTTGPGPAIFILMVGFFGLMLTEGKSPRKKKNIPCGENESSISEETGE